MSQQLSCQLFKKWMIAEPSLKNVLELHDIEVIFKKKSHNLSVFHFHRFNQKLLQTVYQLDVFVVLPKFRWINWFRLA